MSKVVVIGLDGAGFHLLEPWLNEEDLPTLSRLMDNGAWQRLQSSYPPVTSPAWRCYSTGVNPGKHGVFWWEQFDKETKSINVPDSESYDAKNVWDYLGEGGFTSAVVNMPTTHPPSDINGWMVSGGGFEDNYTSPPEIQRELEENIGYENNLLVPKRVLKDEPEKVKEVNELIDLKFEAAEYLRETYQPDFLHLSLFVTNSIQHYVWGGEATKRMWKCVDRNIDEFVQKDDNVIIMSDHGSMKIDTVFHINTWLEREGYLITSKSASDTFHSLGIDRETLIKYMEILGIKDVAQAVTPSWLVQQIPDAQGGVGREQKERKIDWEKSVAFASGQGPIYVLATGSRREEIKSDIQSKLSGLTSPDDKTVIRDVFDASELYEGPYVKEGPDLVIDQADGVHIPDVIGSPHLFVDPEDWKWESENHYHGIFVANGPDIGDVGELNSMPSLYDLTPTILHWYDLEVPKDLDGDALTEIFKDGSDPASREVRHSDVDVHRGTIHTYSEEDDEMVERLQDLGYLSN